MRKGRIEWTRSAQKAFSKLDAHLQDRIRRSLKEALRYLTGLTNHRPDLKKLHGKYEGLLRLRVGDWRVIFEVKRKDVVVLKVIKVEHRREAYR